MVLVAARRSVEDVAQLEDKRVWSELFMVVRQHLPHRDEAAELNTPCGDQLGLLTLWLEPQLHQHS